MIWRNPGIDSIGVTPPLRKVMGVMMGMANNACLGLILGDGGKEHAELGRRIEVDNGSEKEDEHGTVDRGTDDPLDREKECEHGTY